MRWQIIACIVIFLASQMHAMEEECQISELPADVLTYIFVDNPVNVERLCILSCVSKKFNAIFSPETFWREIYIKKCGSDKKREEAKSYRENLQTVVLFHHDAENCELNNYPSFGGSKNITKEQILTASSGNDVFENVLNEALLRKPEVFCTCFGPGIANSKPYPSLNNFLEKAFKIDILIVMPTSNDISPTTKFRDGDDVHEIYPNVLWVMGRKGVSEFWGSGNLPNIAVDNHDGSAGAALKLAQLVIYLRSLKPHLTAAQICHCIIESSFKGELYPLLDASAAIEMVKCKMP